MQGWWQWLFSILNLTISVQFDRIWRQIVQGDIQKDHLTSVIILVMNLMEYPLCVVKEWEHLTLDQQLSWYLRPPQTLNLMCNLDRNWNMVNQWDLQEKIQIRQIINVANFWGGDTCIFVFLGYLNMRALSKSSSETSNTQDFHIPKKNDLKRNLLSYHCFLLPNYCVHNEVWGYMEILSISLWFSYH